MIFLIDNQLPVALAAHLSSHGHSAVHVSTCGLERATDREIWEYAKSQGYAIVSKDEDFLYFSTADYNGPPFIWVRVGNCRNPVLFAAFDSILTDLLEAIDSGIAVVEVR